MVTRIDQRGLQSGIYISPADHPPPAFLFVVVDIAEGTDRESAKQAVSQLLTMLGDLQQGHVRDLAGRREGESDQRIDPGTFDFLLGYGARFFAPQRQLTSAAKPQLLTLLSRDDPPFQSLPWASGAPGPNGEGDLCLQFTSRGDHAVNRAAVESWKLISDEQLPLRIRAAFPGFARDDRRSWLGFHDGVSNIRPSQRLAAVECTGDPDWNRGGTYLAFLRCAVDLVGWRELTREQQEIVIGRDKLSGRALEAVDVAGGELQPHAFCPVSDASGIEESEAFRDPPETGDPILEASHIHRANQNRAEPTTNAAHRIFRQGYEYLDGIGPGGPDLGLNFISFQRDLEHLWQILGLPSWLGGVNFGGRQGRGPLEPDAIELISLRAGGLYAVPPRQDPFPGATLFEK